MKLGRILQKLVMRKGSERNWFRIVSNDEFGISSDVPPGYLFCAWHCNSDEFAVPDSFNLVVSL
jgi:hypothetical protein